MITRRKPLAAALLAVPMAVILAACSSPAPTATVSSGANTPVRVAAVTDSTRGHVSTHVLDTGLGKPAAGVAVTLEARRGHTWKKVAAAVTDADGRIESLGPKTLADGAYRATFQTEAYFAKRDQETFFPEVVIDFYISSPDEHYHVPLLLSPFAYSTYRGS